jgi:prepilin signal peptidase PulO-like enzyme (type II secretory pathway)
VTSHLGLMVVFSAFVSIVFAVLTRDDPREQIKFGARLVAGFVGAGVLIGWLLYPLPF